MKTSEDDPSIEPSSLEYIEDSYLPKFDPNVVTPSLDEIPEYEFLNCDDLDLSEVYDENGACHWSEETDAYLRSLTLDQILTIPEDLMELQPEETEFDTVDDISPSQSLSRADRLKNFFRTNRLRFLTRKKMRDVRVTFVDFSKPYLAKISSPDNYKSFLNIGNRAGIKTQCFVKIQLKAIKFSTFSRLCFAAATLLQLSKLIEIVFVLFRRFRKTLIARRLCRLSF